jgi:hypothetical protein
MEDEPTVARPPGRLLRWIAEHAASRVGCERVLLPLLADLQFEHAEARGARARAFVRARGILAFWRAFGITSMVDFGRHLWVNAWGSTQDEAQTTKRLLGRVVTGATVVTALLLANEYPRLRSLHLGRAFFLLVPSIIPVALPTATLFAFALGARLRMAERRTSALRVVVVAGLASFASAAWFTPVANQEFRRRVVGALAPESVGPLAKGDREMTFDELGVRSSQLRSRGHDQEAERFDLEWHKKPALGSACLALALAGAAIASTLRRRFWRFVAALGVYNVAFALLRIGEQAADAGRLPPPLAMWGPFLLVGAVAAAFLVIARGRGDLALAGG